MQIAKTDLFKHFSLFFTLLLGVIETGVYQENNHNNIVDCEISTWCTYIILLDVTVYV
jgi:hypothetical protein